MLSRLRWLVVPASLGGIAQGCAAFAGVLGILVQMSSPTAPGNPGGAMVWAIAIQLMCSMAATFSGRRFAGSQKSWGRRLSILIVIGIMRGVAVLLLIGPAGPFSSIASVLLSVMFYAGWSIGIGHVVQGARDYRRAYAQCVTAAIDSAVSTKDSQSPEPTYAWAEALQLAEAERQLALDMLDRQAHLVADPGIRAGLSQAARDIYQGIDERIRPTSHRLWSHAQPEAPRIMPATALLTSLTHWQAPLLAATATSTLAVFLGAARLGPGAMFVLSAGTVIVVGGLLAVRRLVAGTGRMSGFVRAALFILILPIGSVVFDVLGSRVLALPPAPANSIVVALAAGVIAFTITTVRGVNVRRMTLIDEVREQVANGAWAELGQAMREARASSEAGIYLHHQVQSHLLATAISLELAASNDQDPAAELAHIRDRLDLGFPKLGRESGEERFASIRDDWAGICDVEISVESTLGATAQEWSCLDDLAREAVASGVRRAGASWARIQAERSAAGEIVVTFSSDGRSQPGSNPGLGSSWARIFLQPEDDRVIPGPAWQASIRA